MDRRIENRIKMLRSTLHHFDAHPDAWDADGPLGELVGTLRQRFREITDAATAQAAGDTRGLTEDRDAALETAAGRLAHLGEKVGGYALVVGDADLRRAVEHTAYEWARMSQADFVRNAADALRRTEAVLDELGPYKVTPEEVAAARAAVAEVPRLTADRDAAEDQGAVATDALPATYTRAVPTLTALDRLVPGLVDDAAFVAGYREAHQIPGD